MKTLTDFNAERRAHYRNLYEPHPNGIECPTCKAELWDTSPQISLMSNPPQKDVHCPACKWQGYRVA